LLCEIFCYAHVIPWILKVDGVCTHICDTIEFRVTHVFREGNNCIDRLANLGVENRIEFA